VNAKYNSFENKYMKIWTKCECILCIWHYDHGSTNEDI